MDSDDDMTLAQVIKQERMNRRKHQVRPDNPEPAQVPLEEQISVDVPPEIILSEFDYSVDNHFKAVDKIARLCGYPETVDIDEAEIRRLSSSVTFVREWRDFKYAPRVLKFACQIDAVERDVIGETTLPQFSAAAVPRIEMQNESKPSGNKNRKYFVMNVGGSVWALDWCPSSNPNSENCIMSEFVAVAAHPPESSHHKIGAAVTGRGAIQIWSVLTIREKEDIPPRGSEKSKSKPQSIKKVNPNDPNKPHRPRGRPRKINLNDSTAKIDSSSNSIIVEPLSFRYPECSSELNSSEINYGSINGHCSDDLGRTCNDFNLTENPDVLLLTGLDGKGNKPKRQKRNHNKSTGLRQNQAQDDRESFDLNKDASELCSSGSMTPDPTTTCDSSHNERTYGTSIPADVALPRMMLCLTHNGKVAWDVKWRPFNACNPGSTSKLGYLAVLLGNGALEVWEVPHPRTIKLVYSASEKHIDPRFIKLEPIFKCSKLNSGDRQSIPLTVEWSVSSPHDMILAGCHDGVVVLWKFSVTGPLTETRPLLSFSANIDPIRTLAWAPVQRELDGTHVIMTAGHKGFKFWDIRDPFRPMWEHGIQGVNYGLDWLSDLRCVFGCLDDGTLWFLSLGKSATNNIPVTGKPAAPKPEIHNYDCSSFALWSVHASRLTGMVAYCGEEGTIRCFQLTPKMVNEPSRHRNIHHLCGSVMEEESGITLVIPTANSTYSMKTPTMKRGSVKPIQGVDAAMEIFPPKIVAMHKVRWNVNKGSEKWLCYGGASGLVTCQKMGFLIQSSSYNETCVSRKP